jgi:hypothetical protein
MAGSRSIGKLPYRISDSLTFSPSSDCKCRDTMASADSLTKLTLVRASPVPVPIETSGKVHPPCLPSGRLHPVAAAPANGLPMSRGLVRELHPLEIFHASLDLLTPKICILNIFSASRTKCTHAQDGQTHVV